MTPRRSRARNLGPTILVALAGLVLGAGTPSRSASPSCFPSSIVLPPDVRITAAATTAGPRPVCRVQGVIEKEIGFELWLPEPVAWNGRFLGAGVGGQAGQVATAELARASARGYAAASTDTGHKANDRHWLLGDPARAANYAERANHLLAVKAKQMTAGYFGRTPSKAVFIGCSGGGRQALTEVQRYPEDYDGVIAGAPGVNTPQMSARRMWEMVQHSRYAGVMSEADWDFVVAAAVTQCDSLDGLRDGVIGDPSRCGFDPKRLTCRGGQSTRCLTPSQVAMTRRIYAPLHDEQGRKIDDGLLPGVRVQPAPAPEPFTPGPAYLAVALFGDGVHRGPNWDARTFRIADDLPAIDRVMNLHADDPDIDAFVRRGGKLILYQGWADPLVAPQPTLAYFGALRTRLGTKTLAGAARLFMAPGMAHCRGGGVPDAFGGFGGDAPTPDSDHDLLSALERWLAQGVAPERIIASRLENGRVVQTRPLCAHPAQARYRGAGDPSDAASFACIIPRVEGPR